MRFLLVLAVVMGLVGCSATTSGISIESSNQSVVIGNPDLARRLTIEQAAVSSVNGLLKASVPVSSSTDSDLKLQYRFYWYDAQGLEVSGSDSPWRQVVLHGKDRMTLQAVARQSKATQYRIYIRKADY
ncbi:YcfL protein: an outer membrane lipoprotein that is part of a salvage cluster [Photobacterium aquae]|uniref:YcfL protein: an outer membrane lipoprotein that is part of a salvage cluster n=1 Tax=Photobacterium aquae TaxID=1195763 RepID=A0A0J1GYQ5_9GAMM|nr:YcfL family protein [Photobacterium aquae]KLV04763.1 YcfL protein: an outer membrane lipoprotein that is part of a salvage cluster [Photobacterium aquae]